MTDQTTTPLFQIGAINHHAQKSDLPYVRQTDPVSAPGSSTHTKSSTPDYKIHLHASPEETYHKIAAAIEHHEQLQRHYQLLEKAVQDGVASPEFLTKLVQDDFSPLSGIRAFLDSCLASIPIHMRPTTKSAIKAEKVFNTAELVDAIFRVLPPFDILSAVQLNRTTLKAISNSPALQEILHLRPSETGYISTVFDDSRFTGIQVKITENNYRPLGEIISQDYSDIETTSVCDTDSDSRQAFDIRIHYDALPGLDGKQVLPPKIGELCRRMLICNPRIRKIRYWPSCCKNDSSLYSSPCNKCTGGHWPVKTFIAKHGVTVGNIFDLVLATLNEHQLCPHAAGGLYDIDGVVSPDIKIEATFTGRANDPYLENHSKGPSETAWYRAWQHRDRWEQVLAYARKKRQLHIMGLPMPTFAEFSAEDDEQRDNHRRMMQENYHGLSPQERRELRFC